MKRNKYYSVFIAVLFPLFFNGTCSNTCPLNKITLTEFWKETTNQNIGIDPLGGYLFLYWVDGNGNACHGEPGINGQPGPIVINAFSQEAYNAAVSNSYISEEKMKQLQEFIYANEKYHAKGYHFAQFDNIIWRDRADGKVFMDKAFHSFSKPVIVNPENTVCLIPVYSATDEQCGKYSGIFVPNIISNNQQHPSIGLAKSLPSSNPVSDIELMNNCVLKLPHGKEIVE